MNKLKKIHLIIIAIIIILIIITTILIKTDSINRIFNKMYKQEEENLIKTNVTAVVKKTDSTVYSLTFTALDSNDKIKSIEYPQYEGKKEFTVEVGEEGKEKVAIDYEIENSEELKPFKVTTLSGKTEEKDIGYRIIYDFNDGIQASEVYKNIIEAKIPIRTQIATRDGYIFYGWSEDKDATYPDYFENYNYNNSTEKEVVTLYAVWKQATTVEQTPVTIENESLIGELSKLTEGGDKTITVNDTNYDADVIYVNGDLILDGQAQVDGATLSNNVYTFGKLEDAGTATTNATRTVMVVVKGNVIIRYGVTITSYQNGGYGGTKGLVVYCGGDFINYGTVTMTARGAKAVGQNIYLWKNENDSYEYVPATGAAGGAVVEGAGLQTPRPGYAGLTGVNRQTGGGASGGACSGGQSGAGSAGTSYSGGTGRRWSILWSICIFGYVKWRSRRKWSCRFRIHIWCWWRIRKSRR